MSSDEIIHLLKYNIIFSNLNDKELEKVIPFIHKEHFEKGNKVIEEGSRGRELYLVESGSAKVIKADDKQVHELGEIKANGYFGEMAHLEEEERFATIQAMEPLNLLVVDLDSIHKADETIYYKIIFYLAKKVSGRLRKTGRNLISSLKEKIKVMEFSAHISKSLISLFILMTLWVNFSVLIDTFPIERTILNPIFSSIIILLFAVASIYLIKDSKYPLSFYGITLSRWFLDSIEAILYSIPILGAVLLFKWVLIHYIEAFQGMSLIPFEKLGQNWRAIALFSVVYMLFVPLQELAVRCTIQSSFREFFYGPFRVLWAILASNFVFNMLHAVREFWLGVGSFFLGIFWGFLFEKQRSLIGVSVSHAFIGAIAFFIFDFDTILGLAET